MREGESAIRKMSTQRKRQRLYVELDEIGSSDGKHEFRVFSWSRRFGHDINISLVDKRQARLGLLVTAFASAGQPEHTAVQAFMVNDEALSIYRGLRRFRNDIYADDVYQYVIDGLHYSAVREELDQKPEDKQLFDYYKALSTIDQL